MDSLLVEWLILVLITPVVITVVVLLYGFVGCGSFGANPNDPTTPTTPAKPSPPNDFRARGVAPNLIKLTWLKPAGTGVTFSVERTKDGIGPPATFGVPGPDKHDDQLNLE